MPAIRPPDHDFSLLRARMPMASDTRSCDADGCLEAGLHRAPRGRRPEEGVYWFCEAHASEYNTGWNYFDGMSHSEITAAQRNGRWHPPGPEDHPREERMPPPLCIEERHALIVLGLGLRATQEQIRRRFHDLIKRLHPDSNGGRTVDASRLRAVIWAWGQLRKQFSRPGT